MKDSLKHYEIKGAENQLEFLFGGKCTVVFGTEDPIDPKVTQYTYAITTSKHHHSKWFVYHKGDMLGIIDRVGDNYTYMVTPQYKGTRESYTINYFLYHIQRDTLPAVYKVYHTGDCSKCGRPLTDLTSMSLGIGPVCRGR